jgi:methionyl-tRNA synthetase
MKDDIQKKVDEKKENVSGNVEAVITAPAVAIAPAVPVTTPVGVLPVKIQYDDFQKVELRIGKILTAEKVANADKLLCLTVDFAEPAPRQIVSGISMFFPDPNVLVGKHCAFCTNLAPRILRGLESDGMILAVSTETVFSLMEVPTTIPAGTKLK